MFRDPLLQLSIDAALAVPGIAIDHRLIAIDDDMALLPQELRASVDSLVKVRRASGAARIVARALLPRFGLSPCPIPNAASGAPTWQKGIVGSLAHDSEIAIAAIARRNDFSSLGVDIEPAEALDPEVLDLVAAPNERRSAEGHPCHGRLLFTVKEAVYKAVFPLDGAFLDHREVEVSLQTGIAMVRNGRKVSFKYCVAKHIVALAFISRAGAEAGTEKERNSVRHFIA
jgi:4'-phosphopantetheinyl transferase EntD